MPEQRSLNASERRAVVSLAAIFALRMLGLFLLLPVLAVFVRDMPGTTPALAGLALGVYGLSQALLQIPFGYLSDRIGTVPVMLFVCLLAGHFVYLLSLVNPGWSITLVLLVFGTIMYIGMPVTEAYVISHVSERNRSTILGFYYFASRGGPGLLMPVMGRMIDGYGFDTTFTVVGIATLAIVICCSFFLWGSRD